MYGRIKSQNMKIGKELYINLNEMNPIKFNENSY